MYDILQLNDMLVPELREIAEQLGIAGTKKLNKQELIYKILDQQAIAGEGSKNGGAKNPPPRLRLLLRKKPPRKKTPTMTVARILPMQAPQKEKETARL